MGRNIWPFRFLFGCFVSVCGLTVMAEDADGDSDGLEAIEGVVRYVDLKPPFVANYGVSDDGHMSYVKASVTVRVSSKEAEYAARYHVASLRNTLVLLLSRQDESSVASVDGRETIKAEALEEMRETMIAEEGDPFIDDLMFTNFVVQR